MKTSRNEYCVGGNKAHDVQERGSEPRPCFLFFFSLERRHISLSKRDGTGEGCSVTLQAWYICMYVRITHVKCFPQHMSTDACDEAMLLRGRG